MQLNNQSNANQFLSLSELIIDEEICINLRGRSMFCSNCSDVCPADALTLTQDLIELDSEKCTGCNSCLPSCAAGALRSRGFIPERFVNALNSKQEAHLHCRVSSDGGGGVVIPCHSVLDSRLMLAIKAEGVQSLVLHGLDHCDDCNLGDAREYIDSVISETENWLVGDSLKIDTAPKQDQSRQDELQYQDQQHLDRRSFLRIGGAKAIAKAAEWIVPGLIQDAEEDEDALPFFQADELPQRPSQYAQVVVDRIEKLSWGSDSYPWVTRRINENCSGCLSCGERCPTGALYAVEDNNKRELSFDPALCTDCKLCEKICPENSIEAFMVESLEAVTTGRFILLHLQQKVCQRCGTPFIPGETEVEYCLVCCNEQDLDDEWLEMLSD